MLQSRQSQRSETVYTAVLLRGGVASFHTDPAFPVGSVQNIMWLNNCRFYFGFTNKSCLIFCPSDWKTTWALQWTRTDGSAPSEKRCVARFLQGCVSDTETGPDRSKVNSLRNCLTITTGWKNLCTQRQYKWITQCNTQKQRHLSIH